MKLDLLLVHAPSYFYFREEKRAYGPIADVVPSTPIFEMYPYGFFTLTHYLAKRGYKVAIHNAAALMVLEESYRFEDYLKRVEAKVYGIDLHWLVHAHGALEAAKIIKKVKGEVPVVLGGLSASIYWYEVLSKYGDVDYVIVGDTTEESLERLILAIERGGDVRGVEGLAFREGSRVKLNPPKPPKASLDEYAVDFDFLFKHALHSGDSFSAIPFSSFITSPIGAVIAFKGCVHNCATCGGSASFYRDFLGRAKVSRKSPEVLAEEIASINAWSRMPVFVVGDLQVAGGEHYAEELVKGLGERGFDAPIYFEFFQPPPLSMLQRLVRASYEVYLQLSPETQDESLRLKFGKAYTNAMLEKFIERSHELGFARIDLYFMHGIPYQKPDVALGVAAFAEEIYRKFRDPRIDVFVAPLAPFIDPGSLAFRFPHLYGYLLRAKSLEEHFELISNSPTWVDMLNYESKYLPPRVLAEVTAKSGAELLRVKARHGVIDESLAQEQISVIEDYLRASREDTVGSSKILVNCSELYSTKDLGSLLKRPDEVARLLMNLVKIGES